MTIHSILNNTISKFEWNFKITLFTYISNFVVDNILVYQSCFWHYYKPRFPTRTISLTLKNQSGMIFVRFAFACALVEPFINRKWCDIKRTPYKWKKNIIKRFLKFSDLSAQSIVNINDVIHICMTNHDHHMLISNFSSNSINLKRPNFVKSRIDKYVSTQKILYFRIGDSFKN